MNQINKIKTIGDRSAVLQSGMPRVDSAQIEENRSGVMLEDAHGIIWRMISHARSAGRDYVGQCRLATEAVIAVRPDLSPQDVLIEIFRMRERDEIAITMQKAA